MDNAKRIILVSNRLPVKISIRSPGIQLHRSEGGLATGLSSIYHQNENRWIGWPGAEIEDPALREELRVKLEAEHLLPVFLTKAEINGFYEGFSNETLWPLYHYFPSYARYSYTDWSTYQEVNRRFAAAVVEIARPGDIIWIHDYQLSLVPALVREQMPEPAIGYFQHIPFPSFEIFRLLPWRKEILKGLLGADLVGFHTLDDTRHFMAACSHLLDAEVFSNQLIIDGRQCVADAFPMGIDYEKYHHDAQNERTARYARKLRQAVGSQKLTVSVDRLDYSKGILNRLDAFEYLLEHQPEFREHISFLQLLVPSRDHVPQYKKLKDDIDKKVSAINGKYSTIGWTPIYYYYRSFPMDMLSALYKTADIAMITPMRDGMNLVSKEFIASKTDNRGVLILSEMAGASRELLNAIIVNPNDQLDMVNALVKAFNMPLEEQALNIEQMQEVISKFTVQHWVELFMDALEEVKQQQRQLTTRMIGPQVAESILKRYRHAGKRLIFLDYDGTLVPFYPDILKATPDPSLRELLKQLSADSRNRVVIISGRSYRNLEDWLQGLPLDIVAEHGAWYRKAGGAWQAVRDLPVDWKPGIRRVMEMYDGKTPGSFIEEKNYSLVWHYRNVNAELGEQRAKELCANLRLFSTDHSLQILPGKKVVEVKNQEINKGKAAKSILREDRVDFIMAIGDDTTDEDIFKAMPARAFTIKVGDALSAADYFVSSFRDVRRLLKTLAGENTEAL